MRRIGWNVLGQFLNPAQRAKYLKHIAQQQARLIAAGAEVNPPAPLPIPEPEPEPVPIPEPEEEKPEPVGCLPGVVQLISDIRTRRASSLRKQIVIQPVEKESQLKISQRLVWSIIMVILFLGGALLGTPGEFPVNADGSLITPELTLELLAPLGMLAGISIYLGKGIQSRIENNQIEAGDVMALLKMEDFWVALIGSVAGITQLFNIHLLDEGTQALLVNVFMGLATLLLRDYSQRAPGVITQVSFRPDPTADGDLEQYTRAA